MNNSFDKLIRITFVNWYLFSAEDIEISPNSTLFRGQNGVGKSSILDGIQTCLAGADEKLMSMNAASSNGKRSGRSVKSYVLGEVAESPGHLASEPRAESNSYIALTFKKRHEAGYYSFGVALHAKKNHSSVTKKHFALEDEEIRADDFMFGDQIITWKTFETRLRSGEGTYIPANSAREYRDICASLMSAPGALNQISSMALFRAIKNGLTFKERDSMSEFCRDFILPQQNIEVERIENDYENFTDIQHKIAEARRRLEKLKEVNGYLKQHETSIHKMIGFQWVEQEALVISSDIDIEICRKKHDAKNKLKDQKSERIKELDINLPKLKKKRDEAYLAYENSDYADSLKQYENGVADQEKIIQESANILNNMKNSIAYLIKEYAPTYLDISIKEQFNLAVDSLCNASNSTIGNFNFLWPQSEQEIQAVENSLLQFEKVAPKVNEYILDLKLEKKSLCIALQEKEKDFNMLNQGQSSLSQATLALIQALDSEGIKSSPICDLAKVTDKSWQKGIEQFLGNNREALVIIDNDNAEASPKLIEQAISIFRTVKKSDPAVRSAKLINPEKIQATSANQINGFAASLIKANHPTAMRYLQAQLKNLELVDNESELRQSKRAITRDGMVAANGTIGGGKKINFVLLGEKARKEGACILHQEINSLNAQVENLTVQIQGLSIINNILNKSIALKEKSSILYETLHKFNSASDKKNELKKLLSQLEQSTNVHLKNTYEKCDQILIDTEDEKKNLELNIHDLIRDINEISNNINRLQECNTNAVEQRKIVEKHDRYEAVLCSSYLEKLSEAFGEENYEKIIHEANIKNLEYSKKANEYLSKGKMAATAYATEYNVPDKTELNEMSGFDLHVRCIEHVQRIEKTDIVRYENEASIARDNMINGFRSEVAAKLKDNFQKVEHTFKNLNQALKGIAFNGNTYQFKYPLVEDPILKQIHSYATNTSDIELLSSNDLFSTPADHPAIEIITRTLTEGHLMDIADYRAFYHYDLESTSVATGTKRGFRELVSKGSGGEKGTPYYVALGAAFMTAFKIKIAGNQAIGGAAIAIFDEAFSKIDGSNSKAALKFFEDIGLQVILAAPPESEAKIGPYVEESYNVIRSADAIYLDSKKYKYAAKELLQSDDPSINGYLVDERAAEIENI